jgi:hypothetical protein
MEVRWFSPEYDASFVEGGIGVEASVRWVGSVEDLA